MEKPTGQQAAEALSDFVNDYNCDEDGFVDQLVNRTHRTLQQSAFRVFFKCIQAWAEKEASGVYDLRNEDTVKMARKMVDAIGEDTYISFV